MQNENKSNSRDNTTGSRPMVGFRCTQEVKNRLAREAFENGKTLGGYIEDLVSAPQVKTEEYIPSNDNSPMDLSLQQRIGDLTDELIEVKRKYDWVAEKLDVFNDPKLLEIFDSTKGRTWSYVNADGRKVGLRVNHPADTVRILVQLFKPEI